MIKDIIDMCCSVLEAITPDEGKDPDQDIGDYRQGMFRGPNTGCWWRL